MCFFVLFGEAFYREMFGSQFSVKMYQHYFASLSHRKDLEDINFSPKKKTFFNFLVLMVLIFVFNSEIYTFVCKDLVY